MTDHPGKFSLMPFNGQPPPDAIVVGSYSELIECLPHYFSAKGRQQQFADTEASLASREQQLNLTAQRQDEATRLLSDGFTRLTECFEPVLALREEQLREDQEREAQEAAEAEAKEKAQQIADALRALPDSDGGDAGGELTAHSPTTKYEEQLAAGDGDAEGDLPNELLEDVPVPTGTDPDLSGAREPTVRTPASIGLT